MTQAALHRRARGSGRSLLPVVGDKGHVPTGRRSRERRISRRLSPGDSKKLAQRRKDAKEYLASLRLCASLWAADRTWPNCGTLDNGAQPPIDPVRAQTMRPLRFLLFGLVPWL